MKEAIIKWNEAYRNGNPIVSDFIYDHSLDNLKTELSEEEYNSFVRTLTDVVNGSNKTNLKYCLGSLRKFKYEEPESLIKWVNKYKIKQLFVSEKIDGTSFFAEYRSGKLVSCSSKGDSETGSNWLDKAIHILPVTIDYNLDLDIRGEFTLHHDSLSILNFKNTRNGSVGLLNSKTIDVDQLKYVNAYVYEVLSSKENIVNQFSLLSTYFNTPKFKTIYVDKENILDYLKEFYFSNKDNSDYDIDGVVVSPSNYLNEDIYLPTQKIAFKIAMTSVQTTITGITWELSKNRLMKPVCQIIPTEISGSTITNVTGYNAKNISDNGIGTGAIVTIEKAGEIIPKIVEVIKPANEIELPLFCPECNNHLEWKGVELYCSNTSCGEVKRIESFIKNLNIERVSESSLRNWNITTFDKLLSWTPDTKMKSQVDFYNQMDEKIFHNSQINIMRSFSYDGFGSTLFDKFISECCFGDLQKMKDIIYDKDFESNLTEGIGVRTLEKMRDDFLKNFNIMIDIMGDAKYQEPTTIKEEVKMSATNKLSGKSFLFTGKLSQVRSQFENIVSENGGMNGTVVNKNLSYLICGGDSWNTSSKYKKAEKLNIPIITEDEFMEMVK